MTMGIRPASPEQLRRWAEWERKSRIQWAAMLEQHKHVRSWILPRASKWPEPPRGIELEITQADGRREIVTIDQSKGVIGRRVVARRERTPAPTIVLLPEVPKYLPRYEPTIASFETPAPLDWRGPLVLAGGLAVAAAGLLLAWCFA